MTDSTSTALLDPLGDEPRPVAAGTDVGDSGRIGGMSFETLAVCAFIFGIFAIVAAVFAIGMSARAVEVAGQGGGAGSGDAVAGGGGGPATVDVAMKEFAFDPSDIKVAADGTIVLSNNGSMEHDFKVENLTSEMVKPGGSGELSLKGLAPGQYKFICSVPGHEAAGMKGTITVG